MEDNKMSLPLVHPARVETHSFQPLKAWRHFRKLMADKEDTEQVFHIIRSLSGRGFVNRAENFWNSARGRETLMQKRGLVEQLDDHAALRRTAPGSLGHAYCDFMETEGLTAQGLADEYGKFASKHAQYEDLLELYADRLRDTHDLMHVLTGYGRDALGEASVLAFTYSQNPNLGTLFIAYAAAREIKKDVPANVPVYSAVREAQRHGRASRNIVDEDVIALLAMPIDDARRHLNIGKPAAYRRVHDMLQSSGVNPYDLLGSAVAA